MAGTFNLGSFSGTIPSYGGGLNMQGLADSLNKGSIAGSYSLDKEKMQQYKDIFGDSEMAGLAYMLDRRAQYEGDPQRLKERLDVVGPYFKEIGEQQQRFGLQSNLVGAGIDALRSIPETINAFRAIPLQGLYQQANTVPNIFASYGAARPGFSGIRGRLGGR